MKQQTTSTELYDLLDAQQSGRNAQEANSEVHELKQLFTTMRENSATVAEHHHQIARVKKHRSAVEPRFGQRFALGASLAVLAMCAAVPLEMRHHQEVLSAEAARRTEDARKLQEQQKTDEALLMNVESDLSSTVPQPLQPLSVQFSSTKGNDSKGNNE